MHGTDVEKAHASRWSKIDDDLRSSGGRELSSPIKEGQCQFGRRIGMYRASSQQVEHHLGKTKKTSWDGTIQTGNKEGDILL